MFYQTLTLQRKDGVMVISIMETADNIEMARLSDELTDLCDEIIWDEEIKVVILTGIAEKSFSIGTNLMEISSRGHEEQQKKLLSITEPISKLDQPVIAAINGDAIGQALELALACDMRVATDTSRFGLPHIKEGLIPWDGGIQRLSRLLGRGKALEILFFGDIIGAQEALRIGLVNKVVPSENLVTVVMDIAKEMASKGPIALRYAKEAMYKGMDMTLEQGLRLEADLYLLLHSTTDRTEGIKAFREKRVPKFEGK